MVAESSPFSGIAGEKGKRRSKRLREVAYEAVKGAVLTGLLDTQSPLVEERLAEALEISRTPVREALIILEHEGLVEAVPYQGLFVKELALGDYEAMYEAMTSIEPALARLAAERARPDDIAAMEASLERAASSIPDITTHLAACRDFMKQLGRSAGNTYLTSFLISIEEHADLYLISTQSAVPTEKMLGAVEDRRAILDAVRAGDAPAAEAAALRHAQAAPQRWREYVEQTQGERL